MFCTGLLKRKDKKIGAVPQPQRRRNQTTLAG